MLIIGAGMSGLLAGQYFRSMQPKIVEKQDSLPNNHKALLRFRSDAVSKLSGIPFKKVRVDKLMNYKEKHITHPTLMHNNLYSQKVTDTIRGRSIMDLSTVDRYIAPNDFINRLSHGLNIEYNSDARAKIVRQVLDPSDVLISTMPIHILSSVLNFELPVQLETKEIWTAKFEIETPKCDVYQTVYYPNPLLPLYRLSITGNMVIAEFCRDPNEDTKWKKELLEHNILHFLDIDFGIVYPEVSYPEISYQKYGKLVPVDGSEVKDFMAWATRNYNIYSLGRWGTHRQLLMDDVVKDLDVIRNMILSNQYRR
jgi:hypothetical protein